jgi:hypothetical protein
MTDQFTEISTKSWGTRIVHSIKGMFVGFLMFIVSFGVLYYNEGRVDVSKIAKNAIEIEAVSPAPMEANQQLISTTRTLKSDEKIGDIFLQEGNYIAIERHVEMYSWQEETQSESEINTGGSETTTTTYTYKKNWTHDPENSSNFRHPEEHRNPPMTLNGSSIKVKNATIGIYDVDMNEIILPSKIDIQLNNDNVILNNDLKLANNQYLFQGNNTISDPEVGDIRVSYSVIQNPIDTATIFGKLDITNKKISPYSAEKNTRLYRIFEGNRDTAISTMQTEYTILTWVLRGVGFILMWLGLMALFGPISIFLDVLPIFGSISRVGIGLITFLISVVLSIVTILISMIVQNIITVGIVVLSFIIGIIGYVKNKKKKPFLSESSTGELPTSMK